MTGARSCSRFRPAGNSQRQKVALGFITYVKTPVIGKEYQFAQTGECDGARNYAFAKIYDIISEILNASVAFKVFLRIAAIISVSISSSRRFSILSHREA